MSIYLHKVKSRWQPGENTVMYFPFVEDQTDKIGSATINVTGTKDSVIGYTFDKQGDLLVNNPPTTCRFVSVWVRYNQSHGTYVQSPGTYIGQILYNFSHGDSGWSRRFQILTSSSNWTLSSEQNTTTGVWYHLAMGYDGSKVVAYLNGSKVWEATVSAYTSGTMRFGCDINETVSEYIGESVCWSAEEVEDYYMLTKGDYYTETHWEVNENTIAYYPLENNGNDYSGNGLNLTNNGASFSQLSGVNCAEFSGGGGFSQATLTSSYIGNIFTVCYWVAIKSTGDMSVCSAKGNPWNGWTSAVNSTVTQMECLNNGSINRLRVTRTNATLQRILYTMTYNNSEIKIYQNGVQIGNATYSIGMANTNFGIGQYVVSSSDRYYSYGYVSQVILENKARNAEEVLSYYYQTRNNYVDDPWYPVKEYEVGNIYIGEYKGGFVPGADTIVYYKFDGNLNDSSSNGRDLSLYTGSVTYGTASGGGTYAHFNQNTWANYWDLSGFNYDGNHTISLWINPQTNFGTSGNNCIIDIWETSTYDYLRYAGTMCTGYCFNTTFTQALSVGTWYNLLYTRSGSSAKLYINGALVNSGSPTYSGRTNQTIRFRLNQIADTNSSSYANNAYYSDVIFESKEWSAQEVADYYNNTKGNYGL